MIGVGTFRTTDKARRYVNQVLDSERLSYGPFTQQLERRFAAAHDCRFAVMSNSGTSCLMVALAALKERYNWQDGDEVLVPAVTFIATSNIVLQLNMKPVFVDVDPLYYGIDPTKIEAAITPRTRCIIPVHLFGQPCDMNPIVEICRKHNIRIIEDSCETMFARYHGKSVGSFGDVGCFSTYVAHILITGVGGLCTTNDPELAIMLRSIINHGRDSIYLSIDDDKNKSEEELRLIVARRFSFVRMGYSFRVTEFEGALGLAEFENHEQMIKARRENGAYFSKNLAPLSDKLQLAAIRPNTEHSFMMYPLVLRHEPKQELVNYLERNGIETRDMLPLINQPYYKELLKINENDFPVAKWINESGFYIASHQGLTEIERRYIVRVLNDYFQKKPVRSEGATLIVMSRLESAQHNELLVQNYIEKLPLGEFKEKILVDGAVNDKLAKVFKQSGFKIIQKDAPKARLLLEAVQSAEHESVVVIGIDGTDNIEDIDKLLIGLKGGHDLVIASRFIQGGKRAPKGFITHRSFGNRFFAFLSGILLKKNIADTNNLFRAFRRSAVLGLNLNPEGHEVMFEMTIKALGANFDIAEFPTQETPLIMPIKKRSRFLSALTFCRTLIEAFINPGKQVPSQQTPNSSAPEAEAEEKKVANSNK